MAGAVEQDGHSAGVCHQERGGGAGVPAVWPCQQGRGRGEDWGSLGTGVGTWTLGCHLPWRSPHQVWGGAQVFGLCLGWSQPQGGPSPGWSHPQGGPSPRAVTSALWGGPGAQPLAAHPVPTVPHLLPTATLSPHSHKQHWGSCTGVGAGPGSQESTPRCPHIPRCGQTGSWLGRDPPHFSETPPQPARVFSFHHGWDSTSGHQPLSGACHRVPRYRGFHAWRGPTGPQNGGYVPIPSPSPLHRHC